MNKKNYIRSFVIPVKSLDRIYSISYFVVESTNTEGLLYYAFIDIEPFVSAIGYFIIFFYTKSTVTSENFMDICLHARH